MNSEINLLGNQQNKPIDSGNIITWISRLLALALFLLIVLTGVAWFKEQSILKDVEYNKRTYEAEREKINSNPQKVELAARVKQLNEVNKLIDSHTFWSMVLPEIAKVTVKKTTYSTWQLKNDGTMQVEITADSYEDLDLYLQAFNLPKYNQIFSNVSVLSINKVTENQKIRNAMKIELVFDKKYLNNHYTSK